MGGGGGLLVGWVKCQLSRRGVEEGPIKITCF